MGRHPQGVRVEDGGWRILGVQVRCHDRQLDELYAVARELELVFDPFGQGKEQARSDIVAAALENLARPSHAAHIAVFLQAKDAQATTSQEGGGR